MRVSLKYQFMFDPASTQWPTIDAFEKDLADFFKARSATAERVSPAPGQEAITMLYIDGIKDQLEQVNNDVNTSKRKLNIAMASRDEKGRLIGKPRR